MKFNFQTKYYTQIIKKNKNCEWKEKDEMDFFFLKCNKNLLIIQAVFMNILIEIATIVYYDHFKQKIANASLCFV